ncbi:bifunctional adenosylcobinamide kinase/adenosylcobinamide-phosphate guanylyltransferase [Vibrio sp. SM6]|uniref:Bifunctional adenosylcobalamin biosynthesis protein n=1 Tax=Vibrio agarilyticus TaxID=2726741 RepID=A0A7X8TQK1_9VIBR|nr:bifunctional adenosylcobinamide kinase/adenosylcobinamide-phosphate guanylyltransferase [Vibrio agarilyticus]NLS12934.1 bifunctional adenosylcobinamide kinase/adenosylcobinamide-phosphate guanylyltransferase [Vibrio agarilyticus]
MNNQVTHKALVLGGARSGKSRYAEALVKQWSQLHGDSMRHYIATAQPMDAEMAQRIAHHQLTRGEGWTLHECPLHLSEYLSRFNSSDVVLIDCLTLWLNNQIYHFGESCAQAQLDPVLEQLVNAVNACPANVVMVANEVGLGIVPLGAVSRLFVDNAGRLNQMLAAHCDYVQFVAAGLPMTLKAPRREEGRV